MKLNYLYIICVVCAAFFIQSCSEMNDLHDEYLNEGEFIYGAKVDSVSANGGNGRIELEMFIGAQRIETIRVFWNNYSDSTEVTINNQVGTFVEVLDNMPEKGYIFKLVSLDKFGNKSLPFEVTGKVYGDIYQQSRANRQIKSTSSTAYGNLTIEWGGLVDDGERCDLYYTNLDGDAVVLPVSMSETKTVIDGLNMGLGLKYNTIFIPEPTAIDEFVTEFVTIDLPTEFLVSKDNWQLTTLPTDFIGGCWGGSLDKLWNNIIADGDWYHSGCYGDGTDGIPHHFTIDLGVVAGLSKIKIDPRQDCCQGRNPKKFQIWGITDLADAETALLSGDAGWEDEATAKGWIKLLDVETPASFNETADAFEIEIPEDTSVRYIRYRCLETWNGEAYSALSELTFWANKFE